MVRLSNANNAGMSEVGGTPEKLSVGRVTNQLPSGKGLLATASCLATVLNTFVHQSMFFQYVVLCTLAVALIGYV